MWQNISCFYSAFVIFNKEKCSILSKTKEGEVTKDCKSNNFTENIDENDNLLNILIYLHIYIFSLYSNWWIHYLLNYIYK